MQLVQGVKLGRSASFVRSSRASRASAVSVRADSVRADSKIIAHGGVDRRSLFLGLAAGSLIATQPIPAYADGGGRLDVCMTPCQHLHHHRQSPLHRNCYVLWLGNTANKLWRVWWQRQRTAQVCIRIPPWLEDRYRGWIRRRYMSIFTLKQCG